jgi:two-component system LytT family response regulator
MINAVIVEDEKSSMEYLLGILTRNHANIQVLASASNVDNAVKMIKTHKPDIVFLDIQIQNGSGFDVLDQLKQQMSFEVIFTTGFLDYKERAMDYFAFYYLNKPVQENEIKKVLDMYVLKRTSFDIQKYVAFKSQIKTKNQVICIMVRDEYIAVKLEDVMHCEASGNYTFIHTIQGDKYLTSKNLKRIEDLIENDAFYRVHRSSLINLKYIKSITKDGIVNMVNDAEVLISVRNKKKVISVFKLYQESKS